MEYLDFVVLVVPAVIGLAGSLIFGPNLGIIAGAFVMLGAVLVLLIFQVTSHEISRATGLMRFEIYRWAPSFLVGAAVGSVIFRMRKG
jgi:hypothetical protein